MAEKLIDAMAGNYRLVSKLGAGGMGEVYKGVHGTIGAKVAIKVLHANGGSDPESEERFLREAKAVNLIDHDGVIKVLDAGRLANGRPYLVMELLDGASLSEQLRDGTLTMLDACVVMADVLDAVDAAHRAGVVHRDLKPANIFRTKTGRTVVLDFGIAKLASAARLTSVGTAIGTPHYMSPEQIRGGVLGPAVDIYAAGVVLFELLCGRLPFDGEPIAVMHGHVYEPPPPPRGLRPDIPAALADVMLRALAKDPAHRFADAAAMRDALRLSTSGALATPLRLDRPATARDGDATRAGRMRSGGDAATAEHRAAAGSRDLPSVHAGAHATSHAGAPHAGAPHAGAPYDGALEATVMVPDATLPPQRAMSTVPVADTMTARQRDSALAVRPVRSRRALVIGGMCAVAATIGAVVVWQSASRRGDTASQSDANAAVRTDESAGDITETGAISAATAGAREDASTSATYTPRDHTPHHAAAVRYAATVASMRARRMPACKKPDDIAFAMPHEDDATVAEAKLLLAHYHNVLACKHLRAYDEVLLAGSSAADASPTPHSVVDELLTAGRASDAVSRLRAQLERVEALAIDQALVTQRLARVRAYQRDARIPEHGRGRIAELARDAEAELAAGRLASANLLLDEAADTAWRSFRLRGG